MTTQESMRGFVMRSLIWGVVLIVSPIVAQMAQVPDLPATVQPSAGAESDRSGCDHLQPGSAGAG